MDKKRMIELLKIEHECMLRGAHDDCDRNCADCELVQDDEELHEMYTNVIAILKEQDAETVIKIAKRFNDCNLTGYCPFCSRPLIKDWAENYCGYCGRPVLWEGRRSE